MQTERTLLVATVGQAVLRSHDNGAAWKRLTINQELEFDDTVRCLLVDPRTPGAIFAGAERGLFRSEDYGAHWHRVDCALNDYAVWKLAAHPKNPDLMFAGTGSPTRAALFISRDGGKNWRKSSLEMPPKCLGVSRPRMLAMACDPDDERQVWVGVEEGGVHRSRDGGETWTRVDDAEHRKGIINSDVHSIAILPATAHAPKRVIVMVVNALYFSDDDGKTWRGLNARESWGLYYTRVMATRPGSSKELLIGISDGTPGTTSLCLRSADSGETWIPSPFPLQPNSCVWAFGTQGADPDLVLAGTKYGHLYRSDNGGKSWRKEWREFSEITDVAWMPGKPSREEEIRHG